MGNCQGSKASANAVNPRAIEAPLDVNKPIPSPAKADGRSPVNAPVTAPATPSDDPPTDKISQEEPSEEPSEEPLVVKPSQSASVVAFEAVSTAADEPSEVLSKSASAVSEAPSKATDDISQKSSAVSNVPFFGDSQSKEEVNIIEVESSVKGEEPITAVSSDENPPSGLASIGSLGRTRTDATGTSEATGPTHKVAERNQGFEQVPVKRDLTLGEKMEDMIDSCCGLPPEDRSSSLVVEEKEVVTAASLSETLDPKSPNYKKKRKLIKKVREIEALEAKDPESLTPEQLQKMASKDSVLESLSAI